MKMKKWLLALRFAVITMIVALVGATAIACAKKNGKPGAEAGAYVCYDLATETAIVLDGKGTFTVAVEGGTQGGSYSLTGVSITLTFSDEEMGTMSGTYSDTLITFAQQGYSMNFYKTVPFTVTYNTNGGSTMDSATVINGKTLAAPTAPTRTGYTLLGWSTDAAGKDPFVFGVDKITADTTLYACWISTPAEQDEFIIDFDLNYNGAHNPNGIMTIGGKVYDLMLSTPVRAGYEFKGWAISTSDESDKLSYNFVDGMTFYEDTTFVAVWAPVSTGGKLATPVVSVGASAITWSNVSGVSTYRIEIVKPDGTVDVSENTGSTSYSYAFNEKDAGKYMVSVVAVASDVTKNSDACIRYYDNKILARVSRFDVDGTTLSFAGVENATNYYVSVVCGDEFHSHVLEAVGAENTYDFSNCIMGEDGIYFVVTATAEGYANSTSRVYNYKKVLDEVTGITVNDATGEVSWNAVENATAYVVIVDCGNAAHSHARIYTDATSYNIKYCDKQEGGILVAVYAVADGYGSSPVAYYVYDRTVPATPDFVKIDGTTMTWTEVQDAVSYEIKIGDTTVTSTTNSKDLANEIAWAAAQNYVITIRAKDGNGAYSAWSDDIDARYLAMAASIKYEAGIVSWAHVVGAVSYSVSVNGGEAFVIEDGSNFAEVVLTQAGENVISVTFNDGTTDSEAVTVSVTAYEVKFNTGVAGSTFETQYKAVGDPTASFNGSDLQKTGYTFAAWYTSNAKNAKKYVDDYFKGAANVQLYAVYTPNTYSVVYDYGDGDACEETGADFVFDAPFTMPAPTISSDATRAFEGWYTGENGLGIKLTNEFGESITGWPIAENVTVYAFYRDMVLDYAETKMAGYNGTVIAVSAGVRIHMVDQVRVPETYKGFPVKIIMPGAFKNCTQLVKIEVPNTLENIYLSPSAFDGCLKLNAVDVYEARATTLRYWSQDGVLYDNNDIDGVSVAWYPLNREGKYEMPAGVEQISSWVFENTKVEEIVIPTTVKVIKRDAFYNADSLTKVTFAKPAQGEEPVGLEIERFAFRACSLLEEFEIPARCTSIELGRYELSNYSDTEPAYQTVSTMNTAESVTNAFYDCSKFKKLTVDSASELYSSTSNGMLMNKAGTEIIYVPKYYEGEVVIPSGVTKIGNGAFISCSKITKVTFSMSVTEIGEVAFYGNSKLTNIVFDESINDVTIGKYAFRGCYNLEGVEFKTGSKVAVIGEGAFYDCNWGLTSFTIPASVREIGDQAFRLCSKLKNVTFTNNTQTGASIVFGDDVFYETQITKLSLPVHMADIGGVLNGLNLTEVHVAAGNAYYFTDEEGVLFNNAVTEILYFPKGKTGEYTLPDSIVKLGSGVFNGNTNLIQIVITKYVTEIGDGTFKNAVGLREVIFEEGGTDPLVIGPNAFYGANGITKIELPARTASFGSSAFASMAGLKELVLNEGLTEIPSYALQESNLVSSLVIPSTVQRIAYYGLAYARGLKSVTFAKDADTQTRAITEIAQYAFYYSGLESIEIPNTIEAIQARTFDCGSAGSPLKTITFEAGSVLKKIEAYSFYYSVNLESIEIPKSVESIGYYAFYYSGISELTFEEGGTENLRIGTGEEYRTSPTANPSWGYGYSFYNCVNLTELHFPARLREIGRYAFYYCHQVEEITFAEEGKTSQLNQIGQYAFYYNSVIENITLPKNLQNLDYLQNSTSSTQNTNYTFDRQAIANYAFAYWQKLKTITIEDGGTGGLSFGEYAFYNSSLLNTINVPARLVTYVGWQTVTDPTPFGAAASRFTGCSSLANINVTGTPSEDNELTSSGGVIYAENGKTLSYVPKARSEKVVVPNTVTKIGVQAFLNCTRLKEVEFEVATDPAATLIICQAAFKGCTGIQSIVLPAHATTIEPNAFENCTSLASITLPDKLGSFDASAFQGCSSLAALSISNNNTYSVEDGILYNKNKTILYYYPISKADAVYSSPAGLQGIYASAFYNHKHIQKVVLNTGVQEIQTNAFYGCTNLKEVEVANTVTNIGDYAFYGCTALEKVTFQEDGTQPLSIGDENNFATSDFYVNSSTKLEKVRNGYTFANCYRLYDIVLPARTKVISDNTFRNCLGLQTMHIPTNVEKIGPAAFRSCERLEEVTFGQDSKLAAIEAYTFAYCYSLKEITIPKSVEQFNDVLNNGAVKKTTSYAFYYCEGLEYVYFEENSKLTNLTSYLFAYCSSLKEIDIPASVTTISTKSGSSSGANYTPFSYCTSLEKVTFNGSALTALPDYLFANCTALTEVVFPVDVVGLGKYLFQNCYALDNVVIPDTVANLGTYMFTNCKSLQNVTIPDTIGYYPDGLFNGCEMITAPIHPETMEVSPTIYTNTGITEWVVPESMTEIPEYYLGYMENITSVVMHDGITYIGDSAFEGTSIVDVVIPDSVESVGYSPFMFCEELERVVLPSNPAFTEIPEYMFGECYGLREIVIPDNVTSIAYAAFYDGIQLEEFILPEQIKTIPEEFLAYAPNLRYVKLHDDIAEIPYAAFSGDRSLEVIEIGDSVLAIGDDAFYNCSKLTDITLPDTLVSIGAQAFYNTGIENINIGPDFVSIGSKALFNTYNVQTITVNVSNQNFKLDENGFLVSFDGTTLYKIPASAVVDEYTLPDDITIMDGAFSGSTIKKFIIPESITSLPNYYFAGAAFETVVFPANMKTISNYMFYDAKIKNVVIPNTVTKIGERAFLEADMETVTFEEGGTEALTISNYAFNKCQNLKSVINIPNRARTTTSTNAIGSWVFQNCTSLSTVTFEADPEDGNTFGKLRFGANAFQETAIESIEFPKSVSDYNSSNRAFSSGVFQDCVNLRSVKFAEGSSSFNIGQMMFNGCVNLSDIELPQGVSYIGYGAFRETAIEEIIIPASVTGYGYTTGNVTLSDGSVARGTSDLPMGLMFAESNNLRKVTIKSNVKLNGYFFFGCPALEEVVIEATAFQGFGNNVFDGCTKIATLEIPASVTSVGKDCFNGWTSAQTVIVNKTVLDTYPWSGIWMRGSEANFVFLPEA